MRKAQRKEIQEKTLEELLADLRLPRQLLPLLPRLPAAATARNALAK
jgi:hypothetical protein